MKPPPPPPPPPDMDIHVELTIDGGLPAVMVTAIVLFITLGILTYVVWVGWR